MTERRPDTGSRLWQRWREVDRLFDEALDVPASRRAAFLRDACQGDDELHDLVADLLEITATGDTPLDRPGTSLLRAALNRPDQPDAAALEQGQRIGRYRILGEIGRGGMATVYEAERADGSFERRVAIKVLRRGVDTDDVVRRFLAERQILSELTHPNIARLLDGGATDDGLPYLIMDRVVGQPITKWADERRLTVLQRLELFVQVADAVHHAHERLVVHRDLKPSNILVTEGGVAKLLDFGIAKLLSVEGDELTGLGPRPLTPQYASPEQLRGDTVTTRSDVYQLGILLHVLLTGSRPRHRSDSAPPAPAADFTRPSSVVANGSTGPRGASSEVESEIVAAARATSPVSLRRALRGDLDTIILEALRPDPADRYDSAAAMADDVRRFLRGHPITARPPTVGYRFSRFVRRNRWFLPVAALLTGTMLTVGATQIRNARELERERNEARAQAERAERLRGFLVNLFDSADPYAPLDSVAGREITVLQALESGIARARAGLADQPRLLADLLSAIARVHENLDQRQPAIDLLDEVIAIRDSVEDGPTAAYAEEIGRRASLLSLIHNADSGEIGWRRRLEVERELFGDDHPRVADALMSLSNVPFFHADFDGQLAMLDEAVAILRNASPERPDLLGDVLASRADALRNLDRPAEAEKAALEAFRIHRLVLGDNHPTIALKRVHLAQVMADLGRYDESIQLYREALPVLEQALGPDHFNTLRSWNNLGYVLIAAGDAAGAEQVHRRILESRRRVAGGDLSTEVAGSIQNLAAAIMLQNRFAEAESLAVEAFRIYDTTLPAGHYLRAFPWLTLTESQLRRSDPERAEQSVRRALAILEEAMPDSWVTDVARCRLGAALVARGAATDGEPLMSAALDRMLDSPTAQPRLIEECRGYLARARSDAAGPPLP